jgi:thiol-disulfide isomerase/thioredoxin
MRRTAVALVVLPLVSLLLGCGPQPARQAGSTRQGVDVGNGALVAFKKKTDVPDCPAVPSSPAPGGMPRVTLPCLGGGRPVDVAGLRGPMIVNFWASWCTDCRKEMPALASYARSQHRVRVLGIDFLDTQPGAALQLAQQSRVAYPLVADTTGALDRAAPLPHIPGLPFTAFLDASGKVVHVEAGAMLTRSDVAAAARKYLGVSR